MSEQEENMLGEEDKKEVVKAPKAQQLEPVHSDCYYICWFLLQFTGICIIFGYTLYAHMNKLDISIYWPLFKSIYLFYVHIVHPHSCVKKNYNAIPRRVDAIYPDISNYTVPLLGTFNLGCDRRQPCREHWNNMIHESFSITIFKDMFFDAENVLMDQNNYYIVLTQCHPKYENFGKQGWAKPHREYDTKRLPYGISLGHQHTHYNYGHWTLDAAPQLTQIPKEIRQKAYFVTSDTPFIKDTLNLFDIDDSRIIKDTSHWYFAETLYTVYSGTCGQPSPYLLNQFRDYMINKFGLDNKKPDKIAFIQRGLYHSRHIANLDEIMEYLMDLFPEETYEIVPSMNRMEPQVKYYNTVKLLFGCHGSAMMNSLYMQRGTAIVEILYEKTHPGLYYTTQFTGKYHYAFRDDWITKAEDSTNHESVEIVMNLFLQAYEAIQPLMNKWDSTPSKAPTPIPTSTALPTPTVTPIQTQTHNITK